MSEFEQMSGRRIGSMSGDALIFNSFCRDMMV